MRVKKLMSGVFYSICICVIGITLSCAGKTPPMEDLALEDAVAEEEEKASEVLPEPVEKVELRAKGIGNRIYIEVQNNDLVLLRVTPYNFGIIVDKKLAIYDPEIARSQFPSTIIKRGEIASGFLTFFGYESLIGEKLVFNNPDYKPIMTIIEDVLEEPKKSDEVEQEGQM